MDKSAELLYNRFREWVRVLGLRTTGSDSGERCWICLQRAQVLNHTNVIGGV